MKIGDVANQKVTTLEGLSADGTHPVQVAWAEIDVPQCGYCQPGQMMSAAALIARNPNPDETQIDAAMNGNICRCGTYPRIRQAVRMAASLAKKGGARPSSGASSGGGGSAQLRKEEE